MTYANIFVKRIILLTGERVGKLKGIASCQCHSIGEMTKIVPRWGSVSSNAFKVKLPSLILAARHCPGAMLCTFSTFSAVNGPVWLMPKPTGTKAAARFNWSSEETCGRNVNIEISATTSQFVWLDGKNLKFKNRCILISLFINQNDKTQRGSIIENCNVKKF